MKKTLVIIFLLLASGAVWFFYSWERPAQVLPLPAHPLSNFSRETLDFEGLSLVKGVFAHHLRDTAHGEWFYSQQGLHYYRADNAETSNVVFDAKEKRYGRLTGEFIFNGEDSRKALAMANDLGLKKTVMDTGMGKMIVLFAGPDFFLNGDGLNVLQSKYKDLVTPDVQYSRQGIN